jgi:hypothetical protein
LDSNDGALLVPLKVDNLRKASVGRKESRKTKIMIICSEFHGTHEHILLSDGSGISNLQQERERERERRKLGGGTERHSRLEGAVIET